MSDIVGEESRWVCDFSVMTGWILLTRQQER